MNPIALIADILLIGSGLFSDEMPQWLEIASRMSGEGIAVESWQQGDNPESLDQLLGSGRFDRVVVALPYAQGVAQLADRIGPGTDLYVIAPVPSVAAGGDVGTWRAALQQQARHLAAQEKAGTGIAAGAVRIPLIPALILLTDEIGKGAVPGIQDATEILPGAGGLQTKARFYTTMVIYGALNQRDPSGLPVWLDQDHDDGLSPDTAVVLQRLAWRSLLQPGPEAQTEADRGAEPQAAPVPAPEDHSAMQAGASTLTGVTRKGIAFNLTQISDWSTEQPFLDLFKTARPWFGHLPGQWGGFENDRLQAEGWLDADGWPRAIPEGVSSLTTLILTDLPDQAMSTAGRYELRYEGSGRVTLGGRARQILPEPGLIRFSYTPGKGAVEINIVQSDPADPIRNITVIREDHAALAAGGALFNPDFLARLSGVAQLRFMPWMNANTTTLSQPGDRPRPDDATWSGPHGVPVEVMVALANKLGADPWFTVPYLASDALARDYARIVHKGLDPDRRASVEFSNEMWNHAFPQAVWADQQARILWGARDAGPQYGAYRAAQIADIWTEEFGADAPARLMRVIGTQTGWLGLEDQILNAPAWRKADRKGWRPPHESFDAYAITGYFGRILDEGADLQLYRGWMADSLAAATRDAETQGLGGSAAALHIRQHRFDTAFAPAISELRNGAVSGNPDMSVRQVTETWFPYHKAVADRHGLELVMYEGGTHIVATGAALGDDALTDFLTALNYAPGIGVIYNDLITGWRRVSDQPFNDFNAIESPGRYGSWGTLRWLDDDNPRWQAVAQGQD